MSKTLWRRDPLQLPLAKMLLKEFGGDVDVFDVNKAKGVEQLCWGMKKIGARLKGKVVEVGIDATCAYSSRSNDGNILIMTIIKDNTNSKNLELYSIMGEYDNAGFPLSYCFLSTATAIEPGK